MFTAEDYRRFADEAIAAARSAQSDERRKNHLDMAKLWLKTAAQMDGGPVIPNFQHDRSFPPHLQNETAEG